MACSFFIYLCLPFTGGLIHAICSLKTMPVLQVNYKLVRFAYSWSWSWDIMQLVMHTSLVCAMAVAVHLLCHVHTDSNRCVWLGTCSIPVHIHGPLPFCLPSSSRSFLLSTILHHDYATTIVQRVFCHVKELFVIGCLSYIKGHIQYIKLHLEQE